jgi:general secretion pathway protein I
VRRARGFTLVEVLVALGVFAVISIAVHARSGDAVAQVAGLEARTFASWVARNRLAELELEVRDVEGPIPTGRSEAVVRLGGRSWRVATELSETSAESLRRVEIRVRAGERPSGSAADDVVARLTGFVGPS